MVDVPPDSIRAANRREIEKLHPGDRFRLMFGLPLSTDTCERYYQGRQARASGLPRELPDSRASVYTRAEFYRGWDDEDLARAQNVVPGDVATPEELERFKLDATGLLSRNT